jgi:hypothetical protein
LVPVDFTIEFLLVKQGALLVKQQCWSSTDEALCWLTTMLVKQRGDLGLVKRHGWVAG